MKLIRRALILSSLALVLSGGAAFADRYRGGGGAVHGGATIHGGATFHGGYSHPVATHSYVGGARVGVGYGYRRPIYGRAPVIREHYYDYRYRPGLIVENYAPMDGYVWVRGGWTWNGYEWIWQPGHYQPIY